MGYYVLFFFGVWVEVEGWVRGYLGFGVFGFLEMSDIFGLFFGVRMRETFWFFGGLKVFYILEAGG